MLIYYYLRTVVILLFPVLSMAQVWEEVLHAQGSGMSEGTAVAFVQSGSIVFAGNHKQSFSFQNQTISGSPTQHGVVGKLNTDNAVVWMESFRSTQSVFLRSVATKGPAVAVGGEFSDSLFIGNDTLINSHQKGFFISIFDTSGNYYYSIHPDVNSASLNAIEFDSDNKLLVTGDFFLHFNFGQYQFNSPLGMSFYLFKFDVYNPTLEWIVHSTGTGTYGQDLSVDNSGNTFVAGSYGEETAFGEIVLPEANGAHNAFLASYSSNGDLNWIRTFPGEGQIHGVVVEVNDREEVFFGGDFQYLIDSLDGAVLQSMGISNTFLTKFDSMGNMKWIQRIGGQDQDKPRSLALDSTGSPVLLMDAGLETSIGSLPVSTFGFHEPLLIKFHPDNGACVWHERIQATQNSGSVKSFGMDILENKIVVTGKNVSGIQFESTHFAAPNFGEFYITFLTDTLFAEGNGDPLNVSNIEFSLSNLVLYPNPSDNSFTIHSVDDQINHIEVFDYTGKLVSRLTCNQLKIEFGSELPTGFYMARIYTSQRLYDLKLQKL